MERDTAVAGAVIVAALVARSGVAAQEGPPGATPPCPYLPDI